MRILEKSIVTLLVFITLISFSNAETKKKSEMQIIPDYLRGLEWNGKTLRHGYIRWLEKKPYVLIVDDKLAKEGAVVYSKNCLDCHGDKGEGDGPLAKKFGVKFASIKNIPDTLGNHALFVEVAEGKGDKHQWVGALTEEEIWALTHYLQSLKISKK